MPTMAIVQSTHQLRITKIATAVIKPIIFKYLNMETCRFWNKSGNATAARTPKPLTEPTELNAFESANLNIAIFKYLNT